MGQTEAEPMTHMARGLEQIPWLYDVLMWTQPRLARWRKALLSDVSGQVLEVGCGTGLTFRHYPDGVGLYGLDPALDSLEKAHRRVPNVPLLNGSVEALPFVDDCFDCVVSSLVFCSVPDPKLGLAEIRRVLKPGGRLLMLEHVQARSTAGAWMLDRIQPFWTRLAGGCHPNRDTEARVERSGFTIDRDSLRVRGVLRSFTAFPD